MSGTDRWHHIKSLFRGAQQVAAGERQAWLERECADDRELLGDVTRLLAAQGSSDDLLDAGATGLLRNMRDAAPRADLAGSRIGAYRLVRRLGEGGMGVVYLAEREAGDFTQRVALKLLRADFAGAATHERFERERSFLAQLVHAHVAQLHEGGVTDDGTPYFTLEYVEGETITAFCDARRLDVRSRAELVLQVCAAVAYAHRNLIVHRDLKPSNIFVTGDGDVKLLDFGIAKLVDPEAAAGQTATHSRLMTPEYAAPEQVLGEAITTATDVYAIGVLLYELFSGRLPYARADAGTISYPKAVVEESPEPFHRALQRTTRRSNTTAEEVAAARATTLPGLRRSLRGDLERVVQRALAKQPDARYASVAALADDLRAFIDGRAISGGSRRYRLRMFMRRHWLPLSAAALLALVLVASGTAIVWQSRQIAREAQTTLAVKDFLLGLFTAVDPILAKGRMITANELLDRGTERVGSNTTLDAEQRAEIQATLGRIYSRLGMYAQGDKLQASAIPALATNTGLLARTQRERAETLVDLGDLKAAMELAEGARRNIESWPQATIADRAQLLRVQARIATSQRDFVAATRYAQLELALARQIADTDSKAVLDALVTSGAAHWGLDQVDEAEADYRQALALAARDSDPDSFDLAKVRGNLAMVLRSKSRYAEAKQLVLQALATEQKLVGGEHALTLNLKRDLALTNYHLGFYGDARSMLEEVIAVQRRQLGAAHPAIAGADINLGLLLVDSGDADAGERALDEALSIFEKRYGRDYPGARLALGDLAVAHIAQGKLEQARTELLEAIERERKASQPESAYFTYQYRLGEVMRLQGDAAGALDLQRAALAVSTKAFGEDNRHTAAAHKYLALSLRDSGDAAAAEHELRAALSGYASEPPFTATVRYELGLLLLEQGGAARDEGLQQLGQAVELREKFLGADNPLTKQARAALRRAQGTA